MNVSQHLSESDESTASISKSEECLDITLESICDQQEKDATLKLLLQWERSKEKSHCSAVASYCKELKAYWHEWDTMYRLFNVLRWLWNIYEGAELPSVYFITNTKHCITYLALTQLFPVLVSHPEMYTLCSILLHFV